MWIHVIVVLCFSLTPDRLQDGVTPLKAALDNGHTNVVTLLQEALIRFLGDLQREACLARLEHSTLQRLAAP
jgi:hypothetical protein